MKNNFLDQFYTIDSESGDYIIEIALKSYDDIFNNWDSSVYNIRDLDSSLKSFLEECSYDIDTRRNIVLRFNMQNQQRDHSMERNIETGIRNYCKYFLHVQKMHFAARRKRTIIYILVSLTLTLVSAGLQSVVHNKIINDLILLGLTVGGWVFLWEAFSLLFIQSSDLRRRKT